MPVAIGTLAMLVGNVGLQVFNNWRNSRQNDQLQEKREEFERAAREHQTLRVWQIMREGQEIALELEQTRQKQRIEELEFEMDQLLKNLAYQQTISNWPLTILPIVMKNQSFGNLLANQNESFAMHCILTPSNSPLFNRHVFPYIEKALENYCNQYWSVNSSQPVLFYSGAWVSNDAPTQPQISSMQAALSNLPTLLITPFFRPSEDKMVFQVRIWGIGATSNNLDFDDLWEIEPSEFHHEYSTRSDYDKEDHLLEDAINDIVPYLQCLIGYMADTYFWSSTGLAPHLPLLVTYGTVNLKGMSGLVNESCVYYDKLLSTGKTSAKKNPFARNGLVNLYEGIAVLMDEKKREDELEKLFVSYCCNRLGSDICDIKELLNPNLFTKDDLPFISTILSKFDGTENFCAIKHIKDVLETIDFNYDILESVDIDFLQAELGQGNNVAAYRLGELYEYSIGVKWNAVLSKQYYQKSTQNGFLLSKLRNSIGLCEQYKEELECMANSGVVQSIIIKALWLRSQDKLSEALSVLERDTFSHPAILFSKAVLLLDLGGDASLIENCLKTAADNGYIKAQELLSELYKKGNIIEEDPQKHVQYTEKAMLQNSPSATYAMALCYLKGYGIEKSTSAGIMLLNKAIELGSPEAQHMKALLNTL